jgi:hypothetical protein
MLIYYERKALLNDQANKVAIYTHLQVLPFGELHVRFLEQGPKIGVVVFGSPQAFEGARRIGELAVLLVSSQHEIPCAMNRNVHECSVMR